MRGRALAACFAWSSAALARGCEGQPEPPAIVSPVEVAVAEQPSSAVRDEQLEQLAAAAVCADDFARTELYSWTTIAGLARLREDRRLLVADAASGGRPSPLNRALAQLAERGDPIAALLVERPEFARRRYTWPNPFATTMGLGPRRYGDALICIELDERGWFLRFDPQAAEPFVAVDREGRTITTNEVLATPERLAAIFHVRGPPLDPIAYRELVVFNEAMIVAWSIATPQIAARVEAEIALLEALRTRYLVSLPRAAALASAAPDWLAAPAVATPLQLWHASLAFDNERYLPLDERLAAIVETLGGYASDGGPPLRVSSSRKAGDAHAD